MSAHKVVILMKRSILILSIILVLLFLAGSLAVAAEIESFAVSWWTVDGGGGGSDGGPYLVSGTMGQAEAHGQSSGGVFGVSGGFWHAPAAPAAPAPNRIFLPLVVSGD